MESASLGLDLINSVASLAETLPQLLQKISEWNLLRKDVPDAIQNFCTDLRYIQNCLTALKNHINLLENHFGDRLNFRKLCIDTDYCSDKLKQLECQLNNIHIRTQKKCICFPSTRLNRLEDLGQRKAALISDIQSLIESVNTLKAEYDELDAAYINMAPLPEANLTLNFDEQSAERNILDEILRKDSSSTAVGAVARGEAPTLLGPGGVGKTQTICHIAHRRDVRERFPQGIFFIRLGEEANVQYLISRIAHITARAGSDSESEKLRDLRSIEDAVEQAAETFKNRCCLVFFDDVWSVNGIPLNIMQVLVQLVRHPDGKVVYTTRDAKLHGGKQIFFGTKTEIEAEAILLAHSGLPKPDSNLQLQSFNNIIKLCDGLPVALALVGKSVRSLAVRRNSTEKSLAWADYKIDWEDEHVTSMKKVLLKAIDVMSIDGNEYRNHFYSLCVIQKAEQVPLSILARVWSVSEKRAEKLVESLFRFSIIRIGQEMNGEEMVRTIGLHDLILDICREEARLSGVFSSAHLQLIASYKIGTRTQSEDHETSSISPNDIRGNDEATMQVMDTFQNWWLGVSDDSYIYGNIIRLLQVCNRHDDVIWLVNKPKWIVLQFERNGIQMVRSNICSAINTVRQVYWTDDNGNLRVRWLQTLSKALTESLVQIQMSNWPGMIWTQLYGRLQNFTPKDNLVHKFLSEIECEAPRPWLKPSETAFNTPSSNLEENFMLDGSYLDHTEVPGGVSFLTAKGDQLDVCQFKFGNDKISSQTIMKFEREGCVRLGLFNKAGFEIFILNSDCRLIHLKKNMHAELSQNASWNNVTNIPQVCSILSDWSAFSFDFGDGHGELKSFDISDTGTTLVTRFTREIGVSNLVAGKWENHFLSCDSEIPHDFFTCAVNGHGSVIVSSGLSDGAHIWRRSNTKWEHDKMTCSNPESDSGTCAVTFMRLSTNGNRVVTCGYHDEVRVFEKEETSSVNYRWNQKHVGKHNNGICTVAIRGDGNQFVCFLFDGSIHLWTYSDCEWKDTFIGCHNDSVHYVVQVAFLVRQGKLLSVSDSDVVCIWDITEQSCMKNNQTPSYTYLKTYTSKHGNRSVSLLSSTNDKKRLIRVVDKLDGSGSSWTEEDIEVSCDVFKLQLVEEDRKIVSIDPQPSVLLWVRKNEGWTSEILEVKGIEVKSMQPNVERFFIGADHAEMLFLTKSDLIWKVQAIALPSISVISDNIAEGKRVVAFFNDASRTWNGHGMDEPELRTFVPNNAEVSPCGNQILFPFANVIYLVQHDGEHWKDEILEGHRSPVIYVALNSDGRRIVSGEAHDCDDLVWTKSENKWKHENITIHSRIQNHHYRKALSIAKQMVSNPLNFYSGDNHWFLMKTFDWAIRLYMQQSDGTWAESDLSGYLPMNFLEVMDSKWYKEEQLDIYLRESIKLIVNEKRFYRLSNRVLFNHSRRNEKVQLHIIEKPIPVTVSTLDVLMN